MKKKILIVGTSGFLGSNCLKYFLKKNKYKIYTLTRYKQKYPKSVEQIVVNLKNYKKLRYKLKKLNFNYVINLSLYVDHITDHEKGIKLLNNNLKCTYNLINSLNRSKLERFIHIGSADEYRISNKIINEKSMIEASNYYSLSKIYITNYLILLHKLENFPIVILRAFLVYGEFQKDNRLIPYIINNGIRKNKINLSSTNFKRDFLYISDFLDAINKVFNNKKSLGEIFNICYGASYSIKQITKLIKLELNDLDLSFDTFRRKYKEPPEVFANNIKAFKILKWKPKTNIKSGLMKTINFYKKIHE